MRPDGRHPNEVRRITIEPDFIRYPEGSVLWRAGDTVVLCNVSLSDMTAEYAMLPRATDTRSDREVKKGGPSGRSQEIQRLIGRSLRAAVRRDLMGERTLTADCDVLQADGSTRTNSISGAWTAITIALCRMYEQGRRGLRLRCRSHPGLHRLGQARRGPGHRRRRRLLTRRVQRHAGNGLERRPAGHGETTRGRGSQARGSRVAKAVVPPGTGKD